MFTNDLIFGFIVFGVAAVANRVLAERALKRLDTEQKAGLIDAFAKHRIFHVVTVLILLIVYLVGLRAWPQLIVPIVYGVLILLVLTSIGNGVFSYLKLKKLSAPRNYVSNFLVRSLALNSALLLLAFILGMKMFPS